jgi:plasmid stabilization system protein ParE
MSIYALTPLAKADIFLHLELHCGNSEAAADRVEQAIYDACALVAEAPMRGLPDPTLQAVPFGSGR